MEIWKDIPGYEGKYQVSSLGEIRSLLRKNIKVIKPRNCEGYGKVTLTKGDIKKQFLVHRLVGITFIQNKENKPQINHINGIKTDNRVENLEWATSRENNNHAIVNGLRKNFGRKKGFGKSVKQITKDGKILKTWTSLTQAAVGLNISIYGISRCCRGKTKAYAGFIWKVNK